MCLLGSSLPWALVLLQADFVSKTKKKKQASKQTAKTSKKGTRGHTCEGMFIKCLHPPSEEYSSHFMKVFKKPVHFEYSIFLVREYILRLLILELALLLCSSETDCCFKHVS